jgi:hypothetical protein
LVLTPTCLLINNAKAASAESTHSTLSEWHEQALTALLVQALASASSSFNLIARHRKLECADFGRIAIR